MPVTRLCGDCHPETDTVHLTGANLATQNTPNSPETVTRSGPFLFNVTLRSAFCNDNLMMVLLLLLLFAPKGPCCCFEKNGRSLFLAFALVSQTALLSFGTTG